MYPMYLPTPTATSSTTRPPTVWLYDYGMSGPRRHALLAAIHVGGNPTGELVYNKEEYLYDVFNGKWSAQITPTQIEGLTLTGSLSDTGSSGSATTSWAATATARWLRTAAT